MVTFAEHISESSKLPASARALLVMPLLLLALSASGRADPLFGAKIDSGTGFVPVSVAIADLNADGRPDLATANAGSRTVSVLLGNGDGTFAANADFGTGTYPYSVAIADLNADGRLDLAVANSNSSTVSVLLNRGVAVPPIAIAFDFTPGTLNLASQGSWVTGYLEPPSHFAASDIDVASIRLNGTVPVDPAAPTALGDHDASGVADLMVKFKQADVELILSEGDQVPVIVTGTLGSQSFTGTDHIRVIRAVVSAPLAGSRLTGGSVAPVRWQTLSGVPVQFALRGVTPNPVQHELRVSFSLEDFEPATLALFDVSGRQVSSHRVDALGPGWHTVAIGDRSHLRAGLYIVRLTQAGRSLATQAALVP